MKTIVDIPGGELADAIRSARARTKREATATVITEFNHRRRMAELAKRAGSCPDMMTADELRQKCCASSSVSFQSWPSRARLEHADSAFGRSVAAESHEA